MLTARQDQLLKSVAVILASAQGVVIMVVNGMLKHSMFAALILAWFYGLSMQLSGGGTRATGHPSAISVNSIKVTVVLTLAHPFCQVLYYFNKTENPAAAHYSLSCYFRYTHFNTSIFKLFTFVLAASNVRLCHSLLSLNILAPSLSLSLSPHTHLLTEVSEILEGCSSNP